MRDSIVYSLMLIGLSVEASDNTAVKIHLINLKTSLSRQTLGKRIDFYICNRMNGYNEEHKLVERCTKKKLTNLKNRLYTEY